MKVYAVQTLYNTDEEGNRIPDDVPEEELPTTYAGPFKSQEEAEYWMNNVYPDGDEDVYDQFAGEFEVEEAWLNDPASLFDTDIRDK